MNTAEQPAAVIDQRTKFGWPVVTVLLGAAIGIGSAHYRLQAVDNDLRQHERDSAVVHEKALEKSHAMEIRQVAVEGDLRRMTTAIESIDRKLDRMASERTQAAGGRR